MTQLAYTSGNPANLTGGANANMADIQGPLNDVRTYINGSNIDDARLTSPNNAIWRTLAEQYWVVSQNTAAGTYYFNPAGNAILGGTSTSALAPILLDPAEFVVAGKTAKLRLRVNLVVGGAPGTSPTFGLYLISALGGTTSIVVTLAAVLAGSTATFTTPAANNYFSVPSGAFDFPGALGQYAFGVNLPGVTAGTSYMAGRMQLAISHV